ncbi:MAG: hypothetical protein EHM91_00900 [Planctomycetota bacterium]|nr:MAG: hypothetical protein EHM91_00900 [Planctomycetota bacterium]
MGRGNGRSDEVARYLADLGISTSSGEDLVVALARRTAGETFDVDGIPLQAEVVLSLPEALACESRILPIHRTEGLLFVAVPEGKMPDGGLAEVEHLLGVTVEAIPVAEIDVAGILVKAHQLLRRRTRRLEPPRSETAILAAGDGRALAELGMPPEILKRLRKALSEPQGLILLTGPAGSGKSATLEAIVRELRRQKLGVATLDRSRGLAALEEALEEDPDAVALDEPESEATVGRAVRAALEGRRVLIAIEAADGAGAIARLSELEVDPHLVGTALRAGLNQRLLRRLCPACREEYTEPAAVLEDLRLDGLLKGVPLQRGNGCAGCDRSGYRGWIAVFEYGDRGPDRSVRGGFQPLVADALSKLVSGQTTLREVSEQIPFTQVLQAADRLNVRRVSP